MADRHAVPFTQPLDARAHLGDGDGAQAELLVADRHAVTFAHLCRDGHELIGHNNSETEQCIACRLLADNADLYDALRKLTNEAKAFIAEADAGRYSATNVGVLRHQIANAEAALAKAVPGAVTNG